MTRIDLLSNPMTTEGDLITGDTGGVPQALVVGDEDDILTVVAGVPGWAPPAAAPGGSSSLAMIYVATITR